MKGSISFPHREGRTSRQAHADLPDGTYERELGAEGFFGPATHMYHTHPPTGWIDWDGPLRPRAFDLNRLTEVADSPWDAPCFLHNTATRLQFWRVPDRMPALARNADGDHLLFLHTGVADLFCDYGHLALEAGDYLVLPRGTMWRLVSTRPATALLIEATNTRYRLPDRGLVGPHAIFDPAVLDVPRLDDAFEAQKAGEAQGAGTGAGGPWRVQVKRRQVVSTVTYPFNPLDAIGWKGDLAPVRLNVRDIRPLMSHRYHLPPSAHTTLMTDRFVVCTFCPRPIETDPGALKVPFFHNNDDFDEVLFYHAGDFFSRDNIEAGMVTFHPSGFTHGPHPGKLGNRVRSTRTRTDEYAVMIDTRDPLEVGDLPAGVEWEGYVDSWKPTQEAAE